MSSPNAAASAVRSPSRLAAMARFATPPGHDPMPSTSCSVPRAGMSCSPVNTMSRKTVPFRKRSNGSCITKVSPMKIAVLGGGGFRLPLVHRALAGSALSIDEIVLQDVSAERLRVIADVVRGDGPRLRATTDLDDAIDGAGLVLAMLRVGGLDARVRDERDAIGRGIIGQETVGAGGLASALRVVPVVDDVA